MAETFHIVMQPLKDEYCTLIAAIFDQIVKAEWRAAETWHIREGVFTKGSIPTDSGELLALEPSQVGFDKGELDLAIGAGWFEPKVATLFSDISFFEHPQAQKELKRLLSSIQFPPGTVVVGDSEYRLEDAKELRLPIVSKDRFREFGFFWVDMLTKQQLETVSSVLPSTGGETIARLDDHEVVRLWDSPRKKIGRTEQFRELARRAAEV